MSRTPWAILLIVLGCKEQPRPTETSPSKPRSSPSPAAAVEAAEEPKSSPEKAARATSYPCSSTQSLVFGPAVPPDFSQVSSDQDADCFGWQEFIALNWPVDSGGFGDPGDLGPLSWQEYMNNHQVFQPNGAPPPPWGTRPTITGECLAEAGLADADTASITAMTMATKFSSEFENSDGQQAAPPNAPAWLGPVSGHNVWYEIRINEDEYEDIVAKTFYTQEGQQSYYDDPSNPAIALPMGSWSPQQTGAIELKAAWIEVDDPENDRWKRYKLTRAVVVDPTTQKCRQMTAALVALHIIHKTQSQPTWIWATFEHVDNAPNDDEAKTTTKTWNFFDPDCEPVTVQNIPKSCQYKGQSEVTVGCDEASWNQPPQYWIGRGCPDPVPVQVTRLAPIDPNAAAVNEAAWKAIEDAGYGSSVWLDYELVNVQWSTNPPASQPRTVPQTVQSLQPDSNIANTVLETYAQRTRCVDCHQFATISGSDSLPSDFSFLLQEAQSTSTAKAKAKARPRARRIIQ